jgi:N-acetylneuraminic acid mutarotase
MIFMNLTLKNNCGLKLVEKPKEMTICLLNYQDTLPLSINQECMVNSTDSIDFLVFGGIDRLKSYSNSVYEFNFNSKKWSLFDVKGRTPNQRYSHSAIVNADKMYIFGGGENSIK